MVGNLYRSFGDQEVSDLIFTASFSFFFFVFKVLARSIS